MGFTMKFERASIGSAIVVEFLQDAFRSLVDDDHRMRFGLEPQNTAMDFMAVHSRFPLDE